MARQLALTYIRAKFKLLSAISKKHAAEKAFELFCTPQHRNKKPLPPIFQKGESLRFQFLNYHIQGWRWNPGQEKKVLILHGFESSVINFDRYISPLIKKGYEVLAFDAPAHGRSSGKTINAVIYKDFINTVYNTFGPIQSFLAHSFGGLALSLALEEIPHDESYKVVLIAPATETTTAANMFFDFLKLKPTLRPYFNQIIKKKSGRTGDWFSVARAIKNFHAQVLWVHDKEDNMTPFSDIQNVIDAQLPHVQFLVTQGLGNRRIYREATISKVVIDFL